MTNRRAIAAVLVAGALWLAPPPAEADITAFIGSVRTDAPQTVRGAAVSVNIMVVGFELEYANSSQEASTATPGVSTGIVSAVVRTPTGRVQVYGALGAGVYRETLAGETNTNTALAVGGGVLVGLAGPIGVRIDYRILSLRNSIGTDTSTRQRLYAGVNLKF